MEFHLNNCYVLIVPYQAAKFDKNHKSKSWDKSLHNFEGIIVPKLVIWTNWGFLEITLYTNFYLFIVPYHSAKFEKYP